MEIAFAFLLCAVIVDAKFTGGHTQKDPAHLGSKVFEGKAAHRGEHKYIASLQLDGSHMCSSGMFQMGFLLTTVQCAWQLGTAIKKGYLRATAVLADPILKHGQKINIKKIAYCLIYDNFENNVGVIMLVNNYDKTHMAVLNMYPKKVDLRRHGPEASVCGWATADPSNAAEFEETKFLDNLHCMRMELHGEGVCYKHILFGDYKRKLMCGWLDSPKEIQTVEDFGSPVTKIIYHDDEDRNVILGVTIQPHVHENVTLYRFIRISLVFNDIQAMVEELESRTEADGTCISKYQDKIKGSN